MLTDTRSGYGSISILLHWLGAAAIVYLWISGQSIEHSDPSTRALHIAMGSGLGFLLLARVVWRAVSAHPKPLSDAPVLNVIASIVKIALLVDIVAAITTGFLSIWLRGQPVDVFGIYALASPFAADPQLARSMHGMHSLSANLFVPLLGLHVLGALKHAIWNRDGTLGRMLRPRRQDA